MWHEISVDGLKRLTISLDFDETLHVCFAFPQKRDTGVGARLHRLEIL